MPMNVEMDSGIGLDFSTGSSASPDFNAANPLNSSQKLDLHGPGGDNRNSLLLEDEIFDLNDMDLLPDDDESW